MKIDFRAIPCRDIEGNILITDLSKELGNVIYRDTSDLGELDLAMRIYREGIVDLTDEEMNCVRNYVDKQFKAFVKRGFAEACQGTD